MESVLFFLQSIFWTVLSILDFFLYPFHFLWSNPTKVLKAREENKSSVEILSNSEILIKPKFATCTLREDMLKNSHLIQNIYEMFTYSVRKYSSQKCLGIRPLLAETKINTNGRIEEKAKLGNSYVWHTYTDVEQRVVNVSVGLSKMTSLKAKDHVIIYADTCIEWFVTAMACFRNNYTIATLYTNLGSDGIRYGIEQVSPKVIITSQHLGTKLLKILSSFSNDIKYIIYFEHPLKKNPVFEENEITKQPREIFPLANLEKYGADAVANNESHDEDVRVDGEDVAIIMYTSGSTGNPKGVMLTHNNVLSVVKQISVPIVMSVGEKRVPDDCFIGYLPLAHIFELCMEFSFVALGIPIGYSSPHTLTDNSPKIIKGEKGDISVLKPTVMIAVPTILDRLYKGIRLTIKNKGPSFEKLFNSCIEYKTKWQTRGFDTPIMNKIIFKKIRQTLGGRLRVAFCGGAPVTPDVQEYLRVCLCAKMIQGYGLTESCGGVTASYGDDISLGEVGVVYQDSLIKLQSWEEGGYTVNDKVGPRGEIILNGGGVSQGYYKCDSESDNASFYTDTQGRKWFRTGDIGQLVLSTGTIKIIDRRKDLVKLQMGEYVSLSKVEASIKIHPIVDTVCVYADPQKSCTVALIIPIESKMMEYREQLCLNKPCTFDDLCDNETMVDFILKSVRAFVKNDLERFEIPRQIKLLPTAWTPETGLITAALKLRRKQIKEKYQRDIDQMYLNVETKNNK